MKASLLLSSAIEKSFLTVTLLSTLFLAYPETTVLASGLPNTGEQAQIFDVSSKPNQIFAATQTETPKSITIEEIRHEDFNYQNEEYLKVLVYQYLASRGSPLALHTEVLMAQPNRWKILSLANAESTLCKRYPVHTQNCWGVGGSRLWDFGDSLDDGIRGMNDFLTHYPRRSGLKYKDMTIDQMNGLYKQPANRSWPMANNQILQKMAQLEQQARTLATEHVNNARLARIGTPVNIATAAPAELVAK